MEKMGRGEGEGKKNNYFPPHPSRSVFRSEITPALQAKGTPTNSAQREKHQPQELSYTFHSTVLLRERRIIVQHFLTR